jgi:hypothetical protein
MLVITKPRHWIYPEPIERRHRSDYLIALDPR